MMARLARWLEADDARSPLLEALASVWGKASFSRVRRPLSIPRGVRVIGVGGATLGGSCKTPLAMALARALAERGERVAFVGHAYRARPGSARIVGGADDVRDVGDEALLAARTLAPFGVEVVVGTTRQEAVDLAWRRATCLVIDGLLQTRPEPLTRSLLSLDDRQPWGNQRHPPAGDLRAPPNALLAATDAVILVRDAPGKFHPSGCSTPSGVPPLRVFRSGSQRLEAAPEGDDETPVRGGIDRAIAADGSETPLSDLRGSTFGLLLAIARPDRVARALARRGLYPAARIELPDHAVASAARLERAAAKEQRVKVWLTTAKCAIKLPSDVAGSPVLVLDHRVDLPKALVDWALSKAPLPEAFCPSSFGQKPW